MSWLGGAAEAEAATLEWAVAKGAPRQLVEILRVRPAHVAAPPALAGREMLRARPFHTTALATAEAFEGALRHRWLQIGT